MGDMFQVPVTWAHIFAGAAGSEANCAVACALKGKGYYNVYVDGGFVRFSLTPSMEFIYVYQVTDSLRSFLELFDVPGSGVKPGRLILGDWGEGRRTAGFLQEDQPDPFSGLGSWYQPPPPPKHKHDWRDDWTDGTGDISCRDCGEYSRA